jgi:hypothetical protein
MGSNPHEQRTPGAVLPESERPAGDTPSRPAARGNNVDSIVREIQSELARISAHELDMTRREQEFNTEYRRLKSTAQLAATQELRDIEQRLAERAAQLNTQSIELSARRERIQTLARELDARQIELQRQRSQQAIQAERMRQQMQAIEDGSTEQRQRLRKRLERVRAFEEQWQARFRETQEALEQERETLRSTRAALDVQSRSLDEQTQMLARQQGAIEHQADTRENMAGAFETERAELQQQRAALEQRHAQLAAAEQEIALARDELHRQRQALDAAHGDVNTDRGDIAQAHEALQAERAQLEQAQAELAAAQAEIDRQRKHLASREARLEQTGQTLEREQARLAQERQALEDARAGEHDQQTHLKAHLERIERSQSELAEREQRLAHQVEDLDGQRRVLDQDRDELRVRQERLEQREAHLRERATAFQNEQDALKTRTDQLAAEEKDLLQRRSDLEQAEHALKLERQRLGQTLEQERAGLAEEKWRGRLALEKKLKEKQAALEQAARAQTDKLEAQARQRQAELDRLRDELAETEQRLAAADRKLEARAQDLNETAAALDQQRQTLESETRALEWATREVDQMRDARVREAKEAEATLAQRRRALAQTERRMRSATAPRGWRRSLLLGVVVGLIVAGGWWVAHPPLHTASTTLQVATGRADTDDALALHRAALLTPNLLAGDEEYAQWSTAWQSACTGGAVRVRPLDAALELDVRLPDAAAARALALAASRAYARDVNTRPASQSAPPRYADLADRRTELAETLRATRQEREQVAGQLDASWDPAARDALAASIDTLEQQHATLLETLDALRAELTGLVAAEAPRGSVHPDEITAALAADAIYREDRREFASVALQYRTELGVAMVMLDKPVDDMRATLAQFTATLDEQIELAPPAEIRATLETLIGDVQMHADRLSTFTEQWATWRARVQEMDTQNDVVSLVQMQNRVSDAARQLADATATLVDDVGARIAQMSREGTGATREVVVAAVLRGEQTGIKAAAEALVATASKTALTSNIELDAHDRKLRGLRMRLQQREAAVAEQLEAASDRTAREAHQARITAVRGQVQDRERRREALVLEMIHGLQDLRRLDEITLQRDATTVKLRQLDARLAWLEDRIADLDDEMSATLAAIPEPDRISVGDVSTQVAANTRERDAGLAGVTALLASWLMASLTLVRRPRPVATD